MKLIRKHKKWQAVSVSMLIYIILAVVGFEVQAQTYFYREYSLDQGLSQSQVLSMSQDNIGRMWIGTNGGGVNILADEKFSYLTTSTGLPSNVIYDIQHTPSGKTILSTRSGLCIIGADTMIYNMESGLPNDLVFCSSCIGNDEIWIGTQKGLCILKNDSIIYPKHEIKDYPVFKIKKDNDGNVWLATYGKGLFKYENGKYIKYDEETGLSSNLVRNVVFANNDVYVATLRGIDIITQNTEGIISIGHKSAFSDLLYNKNNQLWGTVAGGRILVYKGIDRIENPSQFIKNEMLSKSAISARNYCITADREANIWVGTDKGIKVFPPTRFMSITPEKDELPYAYISNINYFSGKYWLASPQKASFTITNTENSNCKYETPLYSEDNNYAKIVDEQVYTTLVTDKGLWFGTRSGLSLLKKNGQVYNYTTQEKVEFMKKRKPNSNFFAFFDYIVVDGLPDKTIYSLMEDKSKRIWIGTEKGLSCLNNGIFCNYNDSFPELENTRIYDILEGKSGEVLFATNQGVFSIKNNKLFNYGKQFSELSYKTVSIVQDENCNYWLGTKQGLIRWDGSEINVFKMKNGLNSDNVFLLIFDNYQNLYIGTNIGINKIDVKSFNTNKKLKIKAFGKEDGFVGGECNLNSCYLDSTGRIWFGTVDGVVVYDPEKDIENKIKPITTITELTVNYNNVSREILNDYSKGLSNKTGLPIDLRLPYTLNNLGFKFISSSFTYPHKVKYKYRLKGLEENWSPPRKKIEAEYSGLPDGEYEFLVKACNSDDLWNEEPTSFKFMITPPFWKTWWFYSMVTILLIIIIILYVKYREAALRKEKLLLEKKVRERTAEIEAQKNEIRKQADELEKLSIVASETDNAVIIMDAEGNFEWLNDGFIGMYGYNLEELTQNGKNIRQTSGDKNIEDTLNRCLRDKTTVIYESQVKSKSGEVKWAQTTLTPIVSDSGEIKKLVAIDSNIDDIKKAEAEITKQKDLVEQKNRDITDSINYARNIQRAILPKHEVIKSEEIDSFTLFKPRDIVSGDFYWYNETDSQIVFIAADCTGHGVPGAFMSMLGVAYLNEIVNKDNITDVSEILNKLRIKVVQSLGQHGKLTDSKDGMDLAMIIIDKQENTLQFAGANNPLYIIRNGELKEIKGDKMPIAYHVRMDDFSKHTISIQPGDCYYMFSDGFADQFGGPKGKKFKYKPFKNLLIENHKLPAEEQKVMLDKTITEWMTGYEQIDDILVMGIMVK